MQYVRPNDLTEAISLLDEAAADARPIAGGQSLIPMINLRLAAPSKVIDLSGLDELQSISLEGDTVVIGAGVRHAEVIASDVVGSHVPLLAAATSHIGSARIRNVGSIGGSLAHADPAAEVPLACWALGATYDVVGPSGTRRVSAQDFSTGYYSTALTHGEILAAIRIVSQTDKGWGFHEYVRRVGDFAVAASAAVVECDGGVVRMARIAVTGVQDRPLRLGELEDALVGNAAIEPRDLARLVENAVDPIDDPYVPAAYRVRLVSSLTLRAVEDSLLRAKEASA